MNGWLLGITIAFSVVSQAFAQGDSRTCGANHLANFSRGGAIKSVDAIYIKLNIGTMAGQVITWGGRETETVHLTFQPSPADSQVMAVAQQYLNDESVNTSGLLLTAFEAQRSRPEQVQIGWIEVADPDSGMIKQNLIIYGQSVGQCTPSTAVAI